MADESSWRSESSASYALTLPRVSLPTPMSHRPAIHLLSARALTAFLTVWCLGCAAFDPVIDSLLGQKTTTASCLSEMVESGQTAGSDGLTISPSVNGADSELCCGCGCGSCHSVSPQATDVAAVVAATPRAISLVERRLASVTRAPVAPPPEHRAL